MKTMILVNKKEYDEMKRQLAQLKMAALWAKDSHKAAEIELQLQGLPITPDNVRLMINAKLFRRHVKELQELKEKYTKKAA